MTDRLREAVRVAISDLDVVVEMVEFGGDIPTEITIVQNDLRTALAATGDSGGPPAGTKLVLMSDEVLAALGADRVDWGKPDANGWYTPTVYAATPAPLDVDKTVLAQKLESADLSLRDQWGRHRTRSKAYWRDMAESLTVLVDTRSYADGYNAALATRLHEGYDKADHAAREGVPEGDLG